MPTKTRPELFTRREAAVLADVSLNTVDKAIEEQVVKPRRRGAATVLDGDDVIVIALIGNAGLPLQKKTKREIRRWVHEVKPRLATQTEELELADHIVLRPGDQIQAIARQLERYGEDRERFIESRPDVMSGVPVITGTRLPVRAVAERIERGDTIEDLREDYPDVSPKAFEAALIYAQSHPRRGRPARPWRAA